MNGPGQQPKGEPMKPLQDRLPGEDIMTYMARKKKEFDALPIEERMRIEAERKESERVASRFESGRTSQPERKMVSEVHIPRKPPIPDPRVGRDDAPELIPVVDSEGKPTGQFMVKKEED